MTALKKAKNKKSPGEDGITNEFITNLPLPAIQVLQSIFNDILINRNWPDEWSHSDIKMIFKKGNQEDPQNYRPIALENCSFKLLTNILSQRLNNWALAKNAIPDYQNGFRPGRGCIDNIFILNALIETTFNRKNQKELFAVFVDLKGAYDSINHGKLWSHLESIKVSTNFLLLLKKIYEKSKVRIVTDEGVTDWVSVVIGLLQGDPLSPPLFNMFTNDIEDFFRRKGHRGIKIAENKDVFIIAYADDIVILSNSSIDLKDKLLTLEEYCREKELKININKTKIMIFKKRINRRLYQSFKIGNETIEIVDEFKYLGFKFYRTGSFEPEIGNRISAANMAFSNLQSIITNGKITSWETKKILLNSMIESILIYGSEIWGVGSNEKLISAHLKHFKRLLFLPTNTPHHAVLWELNLQPIEQRIMKRTINWWKKLLKSPENSLIKACYNKLLEDYLDTTNWITRFKERTFPENLRTVWECQDINDMDCQEILDHHAIKLRNEAVRRIEESSSLYWYKEVTDTNSEESEGYLHFDLPLNTINAFCQARLLNRHNEKIYVNGISYKFNNNHPCTICNLHENDTLLHLLTKCNITEQYRNHYFGTEEELMENLRGSSKENVTKTVNFIKQSLRIRSFVLNE